MPNWIRNTVRVTERVEEFKELVLDEDDNFDFNRIIKRPDELDISSGSESYVETEGKDCLYPEASAGYRSFMVCKNIESALRRNYNDEISQEDFVNKVVEETLENPNFKWIGIDEESNIDKGVRNKARGYWNLQRFEHIDWYSWSYDNWGTKWNACETCVIENTNGLFVEFETAWATPENIWIKLAELGFKFTVIFADEDFGSNLGIITADGGEPKFRSFDDLPLNDRFYLSQVIYYGVDYEVDDEDEDYEEYRISVERQEELQEMVKEYLM